MPAKIPVFVSAPTSLSAEQDKTYNQLISILDAENFERRALGRSDYPDEFPLKEILLMARHCSGGIILGFSQFEGKGGVWKPWDEKPRKVKEIKLPTPWNQLEAGILFSLRLPLMVFREDGITGGVFDPGVTDVFLQKLPLGGFTKSDRESLMFSVQNWATRVRSHYRAWE